MVKAKETQKRRFREFKEFVLEQLQDPVFALAYLNESLKDDDQDSFLISLRNVIEAHGGDIAAVAQEAKLSRQNLYRILSEDGNPKLTSVRSLLHVLGLELAVQPYKKTASPKKKKALVSTYAPKSIKVPVKPDVPPANKTLEANKKNKA